MRIPTLGARRDHAERYLLLMIVAFAVTVAATRWFLALTGYPKVGGGGLHVAHMLWGGLLLVVAALLPLLFVGRLVPGAESADHHPDIAINYKRVTLTYSTHSEGGLTLKDFDGAAMADRLAAAK